MISNLSYRKSFKSIGATCLQDFKLKPSKAINEFEKFQAHYRNYD